MPKPYICKDQRDGSKKLIEAIIKQAVVDIKSNFKKENAFYFLENYQKTFYNDIVTISKNEMQILISQELIRSKRKSRKNLKEE